MADSTTVLVVDASQDDLQSTVGYLEERGYQAIQVDDGASALRQLYSRHPDAVVIDVALRDGDGWSVVQRIREVTDIPVVVVSARADRSSLKKGFDLSVNGYLVKPFDGDELIDRLGTLLSRSDGNGARPWFFQHEDLHVDWRSQRVKVDDNAVSLTATEFKLLSTLVEHRGWVLTHDQILNKVWGSNYIGERNNVKLYVWYLRRKIEKNPKRPRWILTRRGVGYQFAG